MNGSNPFATEQRSECWAAISGEIIGERDVTRSPSQPLPPRFRPSPDRASSRAIQVLWRNPLTYSLLFQPRYAHTRSTRRYRRISNGISPSDGLL